MNYSTLILFFGIAIAQPGIAQAQATQEPAPMNSASDTDFVLISTVKISPDQVEAFKEALLPYMALTKAEDGCINYFANQSSDDPTEFVTYEHWRSPKARADHMAASYFTQYFKQVGPMFQSHTPPYPIRTQYTDVR